MPHMDMSGSDGVQYADHEVQILAAKLVVDDDLESGYSAEYIHSTEPVSKRGIDSSELAELKHLYRRATLNVSQVDSNSQTQVANIGAEAALGVNIGPDELPTRPSATGEEVSDNSTVVNEQDSGLFFVSNFEEPGVLDHTGSGGDIGFDGGTGGPGSQQSTTERDLSFEPVFGTGPFMDRTDDLDINAEIEVDNPSSGIRVEYEVVYTLYWDVYEAQGGRGAFARP